MTLCKRLIARLDIKGNRLIKGIRFEGVRVIGDPCEAALKYASSGIDELLYIDAVASLYGRNGLTEVLRKTSREVFVPITAGGGIRSVENAAALLAAGADKIAINTASLQTPNLISDLSEAFGSQCVVASIQARKNKNNASWQAMTEAGREQSGKDVLEWIEEVQKLGAGEILLTSVDQDGTSNGPDDYLISEALKVVNIPLVVGGGFAHNEKIENTLKQKEISGISIGSALHYSLINIEKLKNNLIDNNLPVRPSPTLRQKLKEENTLKDLKIGIIDYGMGNQQSLRNALEFLGASVLLSNSQEELNTCNLLTLPGVGAFPKGMEELQKRGLDKYLSKITSNRKPLLGICLGMQMLFDYSEEFCITKGLGLIKGKVTSLPNKDKRLNPLILPHMGWNLIQSDKSNDKGQKTSNQYFVHSYSAEGLDKNSIIHICSYGGHDIVATVREKNIAGFQFHPERSGNEGLLLLSDTIQSLINSIN